MEVRRNPKHRLKNKVNSILVFYSNPGRNPTQDPNKILLKDPDRILFRILSRSYC